MEFHVDFRYYYGSLIDVIVNEGIAIVETAGRNPEPYLEHIKKGGAKVVHKCTSVRFAKKAESIGCDYVSIDGCECAGHLSEEDITSLILIPRTVDAIKIPVIASGGAATAAHLAVALRAGLAEAIQDGSVNPLGPGVAVSDVVSFEEAEGGTALRLSFTGESWGGVYFILGRHDASAAKARQPSRKCGFQVGDRFLRGPAAASCDSRHEAVPAPLDLRHAKPVPRC